MRSSRDWTNARVEAIRDVATGIREFLLKPDSGASRWPTGSHLMTRVLINGASELRHYSLVGDEPVNGCWRIAVKRAEPGRGGSAYMWSLAVGARLEVAAPDSHFELSRAAPEYLLIAGGIGVTPMVGMAQTLVRRGDKARFLYAAHSTAHLAFLDELQALLGPALEIFTPEGAGRIDFAREFARLSPGAEAYVCGPIGMLEAARVAWRDSGRKLSRLVYETFGSSGRHAAETFTARVPNSDTVVSVAANETLLAALDRAGVEVISDCQRGECGLCALTVLSCTGEIDHRDVFLSEEQHAANNKICICVSRVVGGEIVLDAAFAPDAPLKSGPEISRG